MKGHCIVAYIVPNLHTFAAHVLNSTVIAHTPQYVFGKRISGMGEWSGCQVLHTWQYNTTHEIRTYVRHNV